MLASPSPSPDRGRHAASVADAALVAALARAARVDGAPDWDADPAARSAVAAHARRARAAGRSPRQLSVAIRQSLAAAAPAAMTVATFDAVARGLVRHALVSYFSGRDE